MMDTQVLAAFYFGGCLHLVRYTSKFAHLCLEAMLPCILQERHEVHEEIT
jgi:hypothetical protein